MEYRAFWDIGTRDATAIWVAQFVGREIRVLDYYEAVGQPLAAHLGWLREHGYGSALCVLPHDGEKADHLTAEKFADHIKAAGFRTQTVKNQGKGAALKRVEAARRLFPSIWFNETTTQPGRRALGWYHERRDETRGIGLGPEHDWSSHGADSSGGSLMADKTTKLPDGYDDEQSFLRSPRALHSSESYDRENRDAAIDDLEFLAGDQWDDDVKAAASRRAVRA
jgi:phage terminase large subunit